MDHIKVKDLEINKKYETVLLIKNVDCKTTNSNGKKYFDFTLSDNTGEINGKIWTYKEGDEKLYTRNSLVKVKGTILQYQGSKQLKIDAIEQIDEDSNLEIDEFVLSAPIPSKEMFELVKGYIGKIKNLDINNIVTNIVEENKEKLMYYPAAKKNHHALRGGLLYHTLTMLKSAEALSAIYSVNTDLVYAGVILHDMSKIEEMNSNELGIVDEYTISGQLLGHISQGVKKIQVVGERVNACKEVIMLLEHMVLSHHYEADYGSPIKPMFKEAELLHYLDIMDARMYDMDKAIKDVPKGGFSDRIWSLDSRKIYNPNIE